VRFPATWLDYLEKVIRRIERSDDKSVGRHSSNARK
jgi:hypothetical protein